MAGMPRRSTLFDTHETMQSPHGFYHLTLTCTHTRRRNRFLIADNDLQELTKELTQLALGFVFL